MLNSEAVISIDQLKTAIWIYDIDNFCINWSNEAGLELWEADSLAELQSRNFGTGSSDAVRTSLIHYQKAFLRGETLSEIWTITPKGILKEAFLIMSGHMLECGRMAMRCEAVEPKSIGHAGLFGAKMMMSSFHFDGTFISSNPSFKQEVSDGPIDLNQFVFDSKVMQSIYDDLNINNSFEGDVLCHVAGKRVWYHFNMQLLQSDMDKKGKILLYQHNINDRKLQEFVREDDFNADLLTGLLNRRGLFDKVNAYCSNQIPFILYYIDLDGFKMINDSFGHAGGDKILQWVASNLSSFHDIGEACRFGGDEFIWVCPLDNLSLSENKLKAQLLDSISRVYHGELGVTMDISASIGSAVYPQDGTTAEEIINCADSAMYMAKLKGKHQVVAYELGMEQESKRQGLLAQHLSQAIQRQELSLEYQTIYNVEEDRPNAYEALLCWNNDTLGYIATEETLRVAKAIGLIQLIEDWAIEQALKDLPLLRQKTNKEVCLSINISGAHVSQTGFVSSLKAKIAQANLKPKDIIIELTETTLLKDVNSDVSVATSLANLGVGISIDSFGIGNSSLAYLHKIPANILKIDKLFLQNLTQNRHVISYIHQLASSLGMKTLVDGIETLEQKETLANIGIQLQQGFLYSNPISLNTTNTCL